MRKPGRSVFLLFAGIVACANLPDSDSLAQSYPVKPVRLLLGQTAGGGADIAARMVAQKLSEHLVVNVPYKGGSESVVATAGGQVDMSFPTLMTAVPLIDIGKLRALAVTSAKRASLTQKTSYPLIFMV